MIGGLLALAAGAAKGTLLGREDRRRRTMEDEERAARDLARTLQLLNTPGVVLDDAVGAGVTPDAAVQRTIDRIRGTGPSAGVPGTMMESPDEAPEPAQPPTIRGIASEAARRIPLGAVGGHAFSFDPSQGREARNRRAYATLAQVDPETAGEYDPAIDYAPIVTQYRTLATRHRLDEQAKDAADAREMKGMADLFTALGGPQKMPGFDPATASPDALKQAIAHLTRRDPIADHQANRVFDVQYPLPRQGGQPRPVPPPVVKTVAENEAQLHAIEEAMEGIRAHPGALGLSNFGLGDEVKNLFGDREGAAVRAALADIGSMTIRDRSGAAVTAAEFPRIRPFIPKATDRPEIAVQKLARMRDIIAEETELYKANYGPDQGYHTIQGTTRADRAQTPPQGSDDLTADDLARAAADLQRLRAAKRTP